MISTAPLATFTREFDRVADHGAWGLIGVWRGEEREERFQRVATGAIRDFRTTVVRLPGAGVQREASAWR
ncbi:MAG TPA: hypothetical protein VMW62_15735 [Chloroflexota bacterium]|nr:hypothetical protein [Chloroflexota bacterium]